MIVQGNAVLILPDKLPDRTGSGALIIPRSSKEMLPDEGLVVQAGPVCEEIKAGMRTIFPRKSASVIVIDGVDHYFTSEHKIFYMTEQLKKKKI